MPGDVTVALAVVVFGHDPADIAALVAATGADETVIVDNGGDAALAHALGDVRVVTPGENLGYAAAANLAMAETSADWVLYVNPDAMPEPALITTLLAAVDDDVALVGAQVLLPDGERTNAGDNPLHLTGLSWSGRFGQPIEVGPPRDVAVCSGAALLVRRRDFEALGGYHPGYFLYHDDVDLAWRARMAGRRVRYVPAARVLHDYAFDKGAAKWFWLERNRLWTVLSNYEARTLRLLLPLLAVTELVTFALAVRDGWRAEKLRAWRTLWRERASLRAWRRQVQAARVVADVELLPQATSRIDTPLVALPARSAVNGLLEGYGRAVSCVLRPR